MINILLATIIAIAYPLNIDLWFNKEEAVYWPNEELKVFFQTDRDCYVAVYDIEVGGRVSMLFPPQGMDGWVHAGHIYELPDPGADYDYVVQGPEGVETIVALAHTDFLPDLDDVEAVQKSIEIRIEEPEPAKLRIISTPSRGRIYITEIATGEQVYIGYAPRTIVVRPGGYLVEIKKSGYRSLSRRIWLDPGEQRRAFVKLRPY
jgi:hypothetical protein